MIQKRVALVTGGSRGIGRSIVERLAADGFFVLFTYVARGDLAQEIVRAIADRGGQAKAVQCDIAQLAQCEALMSAVDAVGTPLGVFVNNAARHDAMPIAGLQESLFDATIALNLKAPLFLSKLAAPRLADNGRIIYISSVSEHLASPMYVSYAASKTALRALVLAFAEELGPRGITVNAISPGLTDTEMTRQYAAVAPENIAASVARTALKRIGRPEDLANAVSLFASPDSGWITGQVIDCSGGYRLS
jgi:3-oxoacyl-[acyl-carrier protein] reductase